MSEGRARRKRKGPEAIGDLLAGFFRTEVGRGVAREGLEAGWRDAVGAEVAAATRVRGLREGTLVVEVASSALLQELRTFHRAGLLRALREGGAAGLREVREIAFKLGAFETGKGER